MVACGAAAHRDRSFAGRRERSENGVRVCAPRLRLILRDDRQELGLDVHQLLHMREGELHQLALVARQVVLQRQVLAVHDRHRLDLPCTVSGPLSLCVRAQRREGLQGPQRKRTFELAAQVGLHLELAVVFDLQI